MKFSKLLFASFIAFTLSSCDAAWNLANRRSLENDLTELFNKHGVGVADPVCNMIGTTRSATCEFRASTEQVTSLVGGLNLREVGPEDSTRDCLLTRIPEPNTGCLGCRSLKNAARLRVYLSERRPQELRLKSGGAFEYLILFQDLDTGSVCVQVSYAYG